MQARKFELRAPHPQNALDIFQGHWASSFTSLHPGLQAGSADLFVSDRRPAIAAEKLGHQYRLTGMNVLELGPLEAAHTYQLSRLGANRVDAVEANIEAYLKCLIVKEILQISQARFFLGDFTEYLQSYPQKYDLIFASGVLYHMAEPIRLLELMSQRSDRVFLWTHYYDEQNYPGPPRTPRKVLFRGIEVTQYELEYPDMDYEKFWGGNRPRASWLTKSDLLGVLGKLFAEVEVLVDEPQHPNGASFMVAARQ